MSENNEIAPAETTKATATNRRELSPTEERIMAVISDNGDDGHWITAAQIAASCGMSLSSDFKVLLSNLAQRDYIDSSPRGYRLSSGGQRFPLPLLPLRDRARPAIADSFLNRALAILAEAIAAGKMFAAKLEHDGMVAEITVRAADGIRAAEADAATMPINSNGTKPEQPGPWAGKFFSPLELSIVGAATDQWQTAAELALKTGQKVGNFFYAILANLADRNCLESGRNGYRLPRGEA